MDLGSGVVAGPLENDIWKPRCSHGVAKPLGTRLWTQQLIPDPIGQVASAKVPFGSGIRAIKEPG